MGQVVALEVAASVVVALLASLDQRAECRSQMNRPHLHHPGKIAVVSALFLVPSRLGSLNDKNLRGGMGYHPGGRHLNAHDNHGELRI